MNGEHDDDCFCLECYRELRGGFANADYSTFARKIAEMVEASRQLPRLRIMTPDIALYRFIMLGLSA